MLNKIKLELSEEDIKEIKSSCPNTWECTETDEGLVFNRTFTVGIYESDSSVTFFWSKSSGSYNGVYVAVCYGCDNFKNFDGNDLGGVRSHVEDWIKTDEKNSVEFLKGRLHRLSLTRQMLAQKKLVLNSLDKYSDAEIKYLLER